MTEHLIIKAGAGTGKTFTVTEGVHRILSNPRKTVGSEEQQAVWDAMLQDRYPGNIHMTSFTTDASDQLAEKCPVDMYGKAAVTSSSTYSMGLRFAKKCGQGGSIDQWGNKYKGLVTESLGMSRGECNEKFPGLWNAVYEIQGKARLELMKTMTTADTKRIADHFGIELGSNSPDTVTQSLNEVLAAGRAKTSQYDFTDMVYLPVVHGLVKKTFGTLVVDEFQDMGRAQQELCIAAGWKLILIGDPHQAIYGFAGADQDAFDRLEKYLGGTARGVRSFPLNMTRRCAKSIVREANTLVPELRALPDAPEGEVLKLGRGEFLSAQEMEKIVTTYSAPTCLSDDLMILCPTNAPLIRLMFNFQKRGVRSYVHGKDITSSMKNFVSKYTAGMEELRTAIAAKLDQLAERKASKSRDLQLDIYGALEDLAKECTTISAVNASISSAFSDDPRPGWLKLTSIHKSKGLEAKTIVVWEINNCKSRWSTQPWQHKSDKCLEYVADTRAINRLIQVKSY